jgi:hypothetical protein
MDSLEFTVETHRPIVDTWIHLPHNLFELLPPRHAGGEWFRFDIRRRRDTTTHDMAPHWQRGDEVYLLRCAGKLAGFAHGDLGQAVAEWCDGYDVEESSSFAATGIPALGRRARKSDLGDASGRMVSARIRR